MKIKKSDIVKAWNEIEEIATDLDLKGLFVDTTLRPIIINRLNKALKLLGKYVTIKDLEKENII